MTGWLRSLDQLLRGERTRGEALQSGVFDLPLRSFVPIALLLGTVYGSFMGWYGVGRGSGDGWRQLGAAAVKVPAMFLLTLVVTFPSLYVFSALGGCRLNFGATLRLLVAAITINLAVAASLGPIVGFFTLSTDSYPFMVLLNVAVLGVAGLVGLGFLLRALRRLLGSVGVTPGGPPPLAGQADGSSRAGFIFNTWVVIYGLVGAQMGWILRPFIGHPSAPFELFRAKQGNFFLGVIENLKRFFE